MYKSNYLKYKSKYFEYKSKYLKYKSKYFEYKSKSFEYKTYRRNGVECLFDQIKEDDNAHIVEETKYTKNQLYSIIKTLKDADTIEYMKYILFWMKSKPTLNIDMVVKEEGVDETCIGSSISIMNNEIQLSGWHSPKPYYKGLGGFILFKLLTEIKTKTKTGLGYKCKIVLRTSAYNIPMYEYLGFIQQNKVLDTQYQQNEMVGNFTNILSKVTKLYSPLNPHANPFKSIIEEIKDFKMLESDGYSFSIVEYKEGSTSVHARLVIYENGDMFAWLNTTSDNLNELLLKKLLDNVNPKNGHTTAFVSIYDDAIVSENLKTKMNTFLNTYKMYLTRLKTYLNDKFRN